MLRLTWIQILNMSENKPPESDSGLPPSSNLPPPVKKEPPKTLEEVIKETAPEVLDSIPLVDRPKLAKVVSIERTFSYRSGMLPEPSELAAYNSIIPNGADRIMRMAEAQSGHRLELERIVVTSQQRQETRGQIFALIISIFFGSCGLYAALNGQPWFGGIIAGTTLVSIVGIFIYSKKQSKMELAEKRRVNMQSSPSPVPPDSRGR